MSMVTDLAERLRALVFRGRYEREMHDEMMHHIELEAAKLERQGVAPDEARRQARLAFGGVEPMKENVRDANGARLLIDLTADLRFALRSLGRQAGFSSAVILVLGLGIGACAAIYTVVDTVLLRPLPFEGGDRLVRVFQKNAVLPRWALSRVDAEAIRTHSRSFEAFGFQRTAQGELSGIGTPESSPMAQVSHGYFEVLGVQAAFGRLPVQADESMSSPPSVVVSERLAARLLGGPAAAVGKSLTIDGVPHAVIGVLPGSVSKLSGLTLDVWQVWRSPPPTRRGPFGILAIARLRPGVTPEQLRSDLAAVRQRVIEAWESGGTPDREVGFYTLTLRETIVGTAQRGVLLFAAALGLVLLIAIANVATLMMVRTSSREQELGVRTALGAGAGRLARLLAAEMLVLTLGAAVVGLAVAFFATPMIEGLAPNLPRRGELAFNAVTILFVIGAALFSGLLIGIAPMLAAVSPRASLWLRADTRRSGGAAGSQRVRGVLVAAEFALALPTLLGAGLLLNSFLRLQSVDPGFRPEGVMTMGMSLPVLRYPDNLRVYDFWRQLLERVEAIPGVTSVGITSSVPPGVFGANNNFDLVDRPVPAGTSEPVAPWPTISPGYFEALGLRLVEGRLFNTSDTGVGAQALIVSQSWAERYYPRQNVLGREIWAGGCREACGPPSVVVGVISDVKLQGLDQTSDAVYEAYSQSPQRASTLLIRSAATPAAIARAVREQVRALDTELPVSEASLVDALDQALSQPRRWTTLIGGFAACAMLLAALGVFGLMSYTVRQRRREIGVRLALGADPHSVIRMIVAGGMRWALTGCAAGLVLVVIEARWLSAVLFEVGAMDPLTIIVVATLLLMAALLASWVPGLRAAKIHPIEAISTD